MYLCRFPKSSTYATGFLVFSTMPGKLFSFLLDPTPQKLNPHIRCLYWQGTLPANLNPENMV